LRNCFLSFVCDFDEVSNCKYHFSPLAFSIAARFSTSRMASNARPAANATPATSSRPAHKSFIFRAQKN
jgi:hypothetical protein